MSLTPHNIPSPKSGFRLQKLEIWNWGTFDNEIYSIEPQGETSLLTGANASGKTTLVDALLTLLVPRKTGRIYNQTVGMKGERTEETYILGEYGETEDFESKTRFTQKLRADKKEAQSVLLAVFQNHKVVVSFAQARWYVGTELKKVFIIAFEALSIKEHFSPFDNQGEWRKRLKKAFPKTDNADTLIFTDSPGVYANRMRKTLGMRSEKAHTLFNKFIGLKVLGNLDEFVRFHMLEEMDSETEFQKIKSYFKTLNDAHRSIEKAYLQIELLRPVKELAEDLYNKEERLEALENDLQFAPYWFAQKQRDLIEQFVIQKKQEAENIKNDIEELERLIDSLSEEEKTIRTKIEQDKAGNLISQLEAKEKSLLVEQKQRERDMYTYSQCAEALDFVPQPETSELFLQQWTHAQERQKHIETELEELKNQEFEIKTQRLKVERQLNELSDQLQLLQSQKNNITGDAARIRAEIKKHCLATEKEMPFVGELIRVKESESQWEYAIERLLHNFALRIIVPDVYYPQVNEYVKNNNLGGRIVYQRLNQYSSSKTRYKEDVSFEELYHKLDFKQSPYREWLENEISERYNYLCTDDLEAFALADKAITPQGLIKSKYKHEKDDRPEIKNRTRYLLGWENKEKILHIKKEITELRQSLDKLIQKENFFNNEQTKKRKEDEKLIQIITIKDFHKIDWKSIAAEIQRVKAQIQKLQETNSTLQSLKEIQTKLLQKLTSKSAHFKNLEKEVGHIENLIEAEQSKLPQIEETLKLYKETNTALFWESFENEYLKEEKPQINNIEALRNKTVRKIEQQTHDVKDKIRNVKSKAETKMREFKLPENGVLEVFPDWHADTHRLSDSVEFIEDYVILLNRIEKQELEGHKKQFKKYLNEEMITKMSDFGAWLENKEEEIIESIETLNQSLEKIDFKTNPTLFIRLHIEKDYSPRVKDFKLRLRDWKPNQMSYQMEQDDRILEDSFRKIKALLDDLDKDENKRKEVLDVRNWLKFKAIEHYREDPGKILRSHVGTAKLSGGEGSQLTYTILGSAIAYQFGIHSEGGNTHSFRFICVDEAFSKQDEEKARYLMDLCKQLHLQVMVVSPAKAEDVAIVEPYISHVHFVQRKDNRHSVVYDMPIKQLQNHRKEYLQAATS